MHRFGFGALMSTVMDHGDATATLTGTVAVGNVLTATFNNDDPDGAAISGPTYQWYYADTNAQISGATASTYTIQGGDVGHTFKCRLIYTDAFGTVETIFTASSASLSAPLTPTFNQQVGTTSTSATPTFSGVNTGTAGATRWTIIAVFGWGSNRSVTSCALNGTAMTKIVDTGGAAVQPCAIFALLNPTGVTNDVQVTFSGAVAGGSAVACWSITGNSVMTVEDFKSAATADPMSFTMNIVNGGCWIAAGSREGSGAVTLSNQGTADFNVAATPTQRRTGAKAAVGASGTVSPGWDWASSVSTMAVGVSWRSGT